jgi:exodeoxyribonuclease VII large subunit
MEDADATLGVAGRRIFTVSALNEAIKDVLEDTFEFVWVQGEISNFRSPSSGHYYMILKDEKAQIRMVMFRPRTRYLKFRPEDGMMVIAHGRLGVYEPRGEYQVILDYVEPLGIGALALAFDQLKQRLSDQGIFDEAIKKPLPFLPQKVAVVTSPTGAAIRDFLKIIHRRFANIEVTIVPVKVQGDEASAEIVQAIETINRDLPVDVIILTRGGGSLEDLWAFNSEDLALAIRASRIPVVSAVGHEVDVTISDLAADLRAPTPSAAAELIAVEKESLKERLTIMSSRLSTRASHALKTFRDRLELLSRGLHDPSKAIADIWLRLDEMSHRMNRRIGQIIRDDSRWLDTEARALMLHSPANRLLPLSQHVELQRRTINHCIVGRMRELRAGLDGNRKRLADLNPHAILKRGYSITRRLPQQTVLRRATEIARGDRVRVTLAEGELDCQVERIGPARDGSRPR